MTPRDSRGRFVSANVAAAERALEVAVAEAVAILRGTRAPRGNTSGDMRPDSLRWRAQSKAERTLLHAGHTADLLLERAS
jgi:hypothetical protein